MASNRFAIPIRHVSVALNTLDKASTLFMDFYISIHNNHGRTKGRSDCLPEAVSFYVIARVRGSISFFDENLSGSSTPIS